MCIQHVQVSHLILPTTCVTNNQVEKPRLNFAQGNLASRMWRLGTRSLSPFPELASPQYTVHCDPISPTVGTKDCL